MYYAAVLLIAALSAACGSPVNPHSLVVRKQAAKEDDSLRYKIVGGAPLSNDVPYMAQVFNVVAENESLQCGGTLISPTQVLTAAHCLYNTETNRLTTRTSKKGKDGSLVFHTFVFVGGLVSAEAGEDAERERYGVLSADCHEDFNMETLENDICILNLQGVCIHPPVSLNLNWNEGNPPVNVAPGDMATLLGWGVYNKQGDRSPVLRSVQVPIVAASECSSQYDFFDSKYNICAGGEARKDSCEGDSGGPLLAADGTQIGITSNGLACGKQGVPSVYTRVSAFSEWILPRLK